MALPTLQIASICSGGAGLELGIRLTGRVCGFQARTVVYVEREITAAELLAQKAQAGFIDDAPVWSDLSTFDPAPWRGKVDLVTAGLPCQPYSAAGRQLGNKDPRAIWPHFVRVISEMRPALVFLENVPAFVTQRYFQPVGERLSAMGYQIKDPLFLGAADVGASHRRERVWILAHCTGSGLEKAGAEQLSARIARDSNYVEHANRYARSPKQKLQPERQARFTWKTGTEDVANTMRSRGQQISRCIYCHEKANERWTTKDGNELAGNEQDVAHSQSKRHKKRLQSETASNRSRQMAHTFQRGQCGRNSRGTGTQRRQASEPEDRQGAPGQSGNRSEDVGDSSRSRLPRLNRWWQDTEKGCQALVYPEGQSVEPELCQGVFPPGPSDLDSWREILAERPELEPAICRMANELADWLDIATVGRQNQLRILGNGVVPLVAAVAFYHLIQETAEC